MANSPRNPIVVRYWPVEQRPIEFIHTNLAIATLKILPPQYIWEQPPPLPYQSPNFIYPNVTLAAIAPPPTPPPNQENWPPPVDPRSWWPQATSPGSPQSLLATPPVTAPPPGIVNKDLWPTPTWPTQIQADISEFEVNFQLLYSIRSPINLSDWPVPVQPPRVYAQSYSTPPVMQAMPFSLDDWPVPIQPYRVYAEVRRADMQLLRSNFPPINLQDWPLPVQPYRVYATSYSSPLSLLTFVPPAQPPINLEDWPPPIQPPRVYAETRRADIELLHSNFPPINLQDWPLPIQPPRVYAQSYSSSTSILAFVPPTPPPINLEDWPLPTQPYRVYADVRRADIQLLHSNQPPLATQYDWPLPKTVPPFFYAQNYSTPAAYLQEPTALYDWPSPIQPYRVYAEVRRADIQLLHSNQPPINLEDWPLPTQPYRVYAQSYGTPTALLTPVAPPNALEDWPVPKTVPSFTYFETRSAFIPLLHSLRPPTAQRDWPAPKTVPPFTYSETRSVFTALLYSLKPPPPTNYDWPNPQLPFQPTSAKTWIQRASAALVQSTIPPQNRLSDWPNPWLQQTTKIRSTSYPSPRTILSAPVQKPKNDGILWPVPRGAPYPINSQFSVNPAFASAVGVVTITPDFFQNGSEFYAPIVQAQSPEPTYDYPVGHSLKSDYGIRGSRRGPGRLIIGRN